MGRQSIFLDGFVRHHFVSRGRDKIAKIIKKQT